MLLPSRAQTFLKVSSPRVCWHLNNYFIFYNVCTLSHGHILKISALGQNTAEDGTKGVHGLNQKNWKKLGVLAKIALNCDCYYTNSLFHT